MRFWFQGGFFQLVLAKARAEVAESLRLQSVLNRRKPPQPLLQPCKYSSDSSLSWRRWRSAPSTLSGCRRSSHGRQSCTVLTGVPAVHSTSLLPIVSELLKGAAARSSQSRSTR